MKVFKLDVLHAPLRRLSPGVRVWPSAGQAIEDSLDTIHGFSRHRVQTYTLPKIPARLFSMTRTEQRGVVTIQSAVERIQTL